MSILSKKFLKWDKHCTFYMEGDWSSCCKTHDYYYRTKTITRLQADRILRDCIKLSGHPIHANIVYAGVRTFGWIFWKRKKK